MTSESDNFTLKMNNKKHDKKASQPKPLQNIKFLKRSHPRKHHRSHHIHHNYHCPQKHPCLSPLLSSLLPCQPSWPFVPAP
mmetsp:Transcript_28797/g.57729  ORF Transcript_28797/g.57729 Transcript_28797/m.57729 type:complete len:81 (-) Transcript_28797:717-959(-)